MPISEYRCESCEHDFEQLVRSNEKVECPTCGDAKVEKLFSAASTRIGQSLPVASSCPPADAPPCHPNCCRLN